LCAARAGIDLEYLTRAARALIRCN
jgi:hypothetical protein